MKDKKGLVAIVLVIFIAAGLYFYNISGWLMHDDEGTDLYEAWRLQQGEIPGKDFVAEQQPLFLVAGAIIIDIFGKDVLSLRALAAIQILAGALIFGLAVKQIFGTRVAVLTLSLVLVSGMAYEYGRLYRPDGMMFGWELAGLGFSLLAVTQKKTSYWAAAGLCYGIALLWKPFAVFPVLGLALYFLDWFRLEWACRKEILLNGLVFTLPFLVVALFGSLFFYSGFGFYYGEIFRQHSRVSHDRGFFKQLLIPLQGYGLFLLSNLSFLLIGGLWVLNKPKKVLEKPEFRLLAWQLASVFIFVFLTRPFYARYYIYLLPVFALILAWQTDLMLERFARQGEAVKVITPISIGLFILFATFTSIPRLSTLISLEEEGTQAISNFVNENTRPDELVLSDYAGINFLADRKSIPEASIIAGGRIESGIVTGEMLMKRMDQTDVNMVLLHVEGGNPGPHQLVELVDFAQFSAYLEEHYNRFATFNRNGQEFEIFKRNADQVNQNQSELQAASH